ncbi:PAS domain-containing sensor histidine kinase [Mucilaginibacter sp. L3T2-6]|uniref:PAS domain-containing sensor histidine kinase n=1 Tax=Mucilaginibacter sp. L3T2-6 TaxID=3062491 RepID=UPI0026763247|nr:PAS domain-containing sensor histidine kinase [Mucilaginibacter sp. L3T2-6]MDO3643637.1 PAS domain-containing sensor histidine kinase [Mucilaginibacter sp. L3T2-6]MDV6216115.1 PAS domain-containing sensor histidine kinase [Mucilaginibacter sp. L3T2-6]
MDNPELLTAVFEHAIDGIVVIDEKGKIRMANPAVCDLFGYSQDELAGQSINLLMDPADARHHDNYLDDYRQTRVPVIIGKGRDLKGRKKDGSIFPFRLAVSEFTNKCQTYYAGIVHDLSKQKQAELSLDHEQNLNQVKTRLLSMASHELRSPLSRVQLSASLIERYYERLDKDKIIGHLRKIKIAVDDMTASLNDFLSIERIEAGNIKADNKVFDLALFASDLTEEMQQQARAGIQIKYTSTADNTTVCLDQTLLRHCLVNLLSNAIKYSKETGAIEFTTDISATNCIITVKDEGIGIPEQDQQYIFEPFFRAANAIDIQGTGLGLNIVKNYVQLMGGEITFKSREQIGTSFTLSFRQ